MYVWHQKRDVASATAEESNVSAVITIEFWENPSLNISVRYIQVCIDIIFSFLFSSDHLHQRE